jgi:hypothetical protein
MGYTAGAVKFVTTDESWCGKYVYECLGEVR